LFDAAIKKMSYVLYLILKKGMYKTSKSNKIAIANDNDCHLLHQGLSFPGHNGQIFCATRN